MKYTNIILMLYPLMLYGCAGGNYQQQPLTIEERIRWAELQSQQSQQFYGQQMNAVVSNGSSMRNRYQSNRLNCTSTSMGVMTKINCQ